MSHSREEAGSTRDEEDSALSMVDVLEEQTKLEQDASAVLGASDPNNCTYPMGYIKRQAIYACTTCTGASDEPAGICLACSYDCHEGHSLVELYTKRNFRCDCGNQKFNGHKCKLFADKAPRNIHNQYNHNYRGLYCTCERPYPDPDDQVDDEMIQCIVCEDWYHGRHLGSKLPENCDFSEMVCAGCMDRCNFLWAYTVVSSDTKKIKMDQSNEAVDVTTGDLTHSTKKNSVETSPPAANTVQPSNSSKVECPEGATPAVITNQQPSSSKPTDVKCPAGSTPVTCASQSCANSEEVQKDAVKTEPDAVSTAAACRLEELTQGRENLVGQGATFWEEGWRNKLCLCDKCQRLYEEKGVSYLPDKRDTVSMYEESGQAGRNGLSHYEQGMEQLSQMNRVQQVEMLQGYNDMKSELNDYLKKFVDNGKVVRAEDIHEFFTSMQARKKQKVSSTVPYFCR